jgi:predicted permease
VQLGIPISAALFGETGLALHVALVSLHGLLLLTLATVVAELDISAPSATDRSPRRCAARCATRCCIRSRCRCWWAWPGTSRDWACTRPSTRPWRRWARRVVPVCLVLIGLNLAQYGIREHLHGAAALSALKLLVLPAWVLVVAGGVFGLQGTALAVVVMMGALPVGSNALIFAQRYRVLQPEATAAIVVSTGCFMASAALWLAVLAWWGR